MILRAVGLTLLAMFSLSGFAKDVFERDTFQLDPTTCPFSDAIAREKHRIHCFLLEVPENREKPDSRFIELLVVKLDAQTKSADKIEARKRADEKRSDPVIYLTGGPGAKVLTYVQRFKHHGILDRRDLYILEQRGIGWSADFCPFYSLRNPHQLIQPSFEEHLAAQNQQALECAERASRTGVDLTGYNTIENARDVKALRQSLSLDQWNVWGISYGSILGQAYVQQDESAIKAIALDAIMPLNARDDALHWRVVNWYNRVLLILDETCSKQSDCAKHYGNSSKKLREAISSVVNNPIEINLKQTPENPKGKKYYYSDTVAMAPFMFFYEQKNYPAIPALIHHWSDAVINRNDDVFTLMSHLSNNFFSSSPGMRDAILCNDGGFDSLAASAAADEKDHPILSLGRGTAAAAKDESLGCRSMGLYPRDAKEYQLTKTEIPALIIEGAMDPITPPPLAQVILPGFKNGTYVEFPYAGHGPSRSVACAGEMLNLFFDNPDSKPDLSCTKQISTPDFVAPLFKTNLVANLGARFFNDRSSIIAPAFWAVSSSVLLSFAFILLSVQAATRWFDKRQAVITDGVRLVIWTTSLFAVISLCLYAYGISQTYQLTPFLLLFGFENTATYGYLMSYLTLILGIASGVLLYRSQRSFGLPLTTFVGFFITALAAIAYGLFNIIWI
ncbi:alpha/beta fold hydrolase [Pleionea litopenaei]|uniref:Proline iminopeptidase n=1 Tax=Pleionea litopenaei TaxID=3070815 RepID=A0AA51RQK8_9GAMM|nr:alpha/beta fold hydrolase [Pleionea sp. HL-JVS1]WMS85730.1 alpha/beta fold hydrolase [Pleionea sp. HL-JVS1]